MQKIEDLKPKKHHLSDFFKENGITKIMLAKYLDRSYITVVQYMLGYTKVPNKVEIKLAELRDFIKSQS